MELNIRFKKVRKFSDYFSDTISLLKQSFKHFNSNIFKLCLPFLAFAFIITFYFTFLIDFDTLSSSEPPMQLILSLIIGIPLLLIMMMIPIGFVIEYTMLLESKRSLDFTTADILNNFKRNIKKYITFFFASILVGLILAIPIAIISVIGAFIPIIGSFIVGIGLSGVAVYFYYCLFIYLEGRGEIWDCFKQGYHLIKKNYFNISAASYLFSMLAQIVMMIFILVPGIILAIIAYNTIGFNEFFMTSFFGKFTISFMVTLMTFLVFYVQFCNVSMNMITYYSNIEELMGEGSVDEIDQIGNQEHDNFTKNEF